MTQKIILTRGLPGSGKTTWARDFCIHNTDYIRVSRDDIRTMRGKYWIPKQENLITDMEDACIVAILCDGKHAVVDATNFGDRTMDRMEELSDIFKKEKDVDIKIEYKDFTDVPLEKCIENDLKRLNSVGKDVIMKFYDKHLRQATPKMAHNPDKPDCIIVDIDGTLAHSEGRSPYDWDRVGEDRLDEIIPEIVSRFGEVNIILLSGRDSKCRPQTVQWLQDKGVLYNDLFMRKADDIRKDSIVKKEIYEAYIKNRFNVLFILDDRNQVVEMWREQGLKCLQVAEGAF